MNLNELYTQIITENSRSKEHRHPVEGATPGLEGVAPSCGADEAALQGSAHVPARVKCAGLAGHTLEEALDGEGKTDKVTTEEEA